MEPTAIYDVMQFSAPLARIADSLTNNFRTFTEAAGPVVVTALWQGVAVAIGLSICLRLAPRISAAHRFVVWTAAFTVLVFLPVLPILSNFTAAPELGFSPGISGPSTRPWLEFDARWSLAIAVLWVVTSLLRAVDLAAHSFRLRKLWKSAKPVELNDALTPRLSTAHGRAPLQLCTSEELDRPSVIGFFAPRILIPAWLLDRLTPAELDQ